MNATPFVIWFEQRSGSTHLVSLLDSHSRIACFPEIFFKGEGAADRDYFNASGCGTVAEFLDALFAYRWGRNGANLPNGDYQRKPVSAVGFKLKYSQANRYPEIFDYLTRRRDDIRVLHLVRTNALAAIVSAQSLENVLAHFGRANIRNSVSLDGFNQTVELDCHHLLERLEDYQANLEAARRRVCNFEHRIEIRYEDIVSSQRPTLARISKFLDVPNQSGLTSSYQKILQGKMSAAISNYQDVHASLRGTQFEKFLL